MHRLLEFWVSGQRVPQEKDARRGNDKR